jgi:hypothetical protein
MKCQFEEAGIENIDYPWIKTTMKKVLGSLFAVAVAVAARAQITQPALPPGKIAVFKCGTPDSNFPMITARVAPCFVQVFDPALVEQSSANAVVSVAMSTNSSVPGSVWVNHHAGSEGGGISRTTDRQFLVLEGYVGNILSPTAAKPSTDPTVNRGIVTLDAFTNATSVLSTPTGWFGIPLGAAPGTQDNPTGIASPDGTNFYGTGNYAAVGVGSGELDGTLFYNSASGNLQEVQQYIQAAGQARIIGGTLYVATTTGVYDFIDPSSGAVVPLPWNPNVPVPYFNFAFTNLYINWGSTFTKVLNFDMDPARTVAYGADQKFGIVKFVNNGGTWSQAPYFFNTFNLGTTNQASGNQGCFGICVDFSGPNSVIYATTMENGTPSYYPGGLGVNTAQGHQNNNRLIKIVDTGVAPGNSYVATTLAIAATTNEFFGGLDFTPDLRPLITSQPVDYATTNGGSAFFNVTAQSAYPLSYQWLQNGTNLDGATSATLNLSSLDTSSDSFIYQCVVTNNYGAATSIVATLNVTLTPTAPVITSGTNQVTAFVGGAVTFAPVTARGTQPFTYQWYDKSGNPLSDGAKYAGSATPSLTISNLLTPDDAGNYWMVVGNPSASVASNVVDVLTVNYRKATITANQPQSVTTFVGTPTSITATSSGGTPPISSQWYKGATLLTDGSEYTGTTTPTLNIAATTTTDSGNNYFIVVSNPGGSVTSQLATVTVMVPPPHSAVNYSNQVYTQKFDALPDPGTAGVAANGTANASGISVNSINNPADPGSINGLAYSLANPFDFAYPVILNSYIGGLGLSTGVNNMNGWYGVADTNLADSVDGISRFGAQNGDQSTGGVIDFGLNDVNGGVVGTNRALGLLSTSTTGSTAIGLKLINTSGQNLNYINLSFLGELWRNNKAARTMSFSYAVDPTANSFVLISQPEATNTTPQDIPGTISVAGLAFSFPTNNGSILAMDGNQSSNQVSLVASNFALATPWQSGAALWLIWSVNYYGQGTGQGYAIDNLRFSASVLPSTLVQPITINAGSFAITGSGPAATASFSFTNGPGLTFSVRATNKITAPKSTWPVIGTVTDNVTPGLYQFADPNAATNSSLFYLISFP